MAFGQTNAKTLAMSVDGVLSAVSDNPIKNKAVTAALTGLIADREAGAPNAGDFMLFWDAAAGVLKKVPVATVLGGYRCTVGGESLVSYGKNELSPCPLRREFDTGGLVDTENNRLMMYADGVAQLTLSLLVVTTSFGRAILKIRINGNVMKTISKNATTLTGMTETVYLAVAQGDCIDFVLATDGDSNERARIDLSQASLTLLPGAVLP